VQEDVHLLSVLRYIERNPVRAKLTRRAEAWAWGSCFVRQHRAHALHSLLAPWPVARPARWLELLNTPQEEREEGPVKDSIKRGGPLGDERWTQTTARSLRLDQTLRPRGRPVGWRKAKSGGKANKGSRHL